MRKMIIGVAGQAGSGKDTVSDLIVKEFGYKHISVSDTLRLFISACGLKASRKLQLDTANNLRSNFGNNFLVETALKKVSDYKKVVISGIYCIEEAKHIKSLGGKIIYILPNDLSFKRIKNRQDSDRDEISLSELNSAIERENSGHEPNEANVSKIKNAADVIIENSGTLDELKLKIYGYVKRIDY